MSQQNVPPDKSLTSQAQPSKIARLTNKKSVLYTAIIAAITYGSRFFDWGMKFIDWLQRYDYIAGQNTKSYYFLAWLFSPRGSEVLFFLALIAFFIAVILAINPKEQQGQPSFQPAGNSQPIDTPPSAEETKPVSATHAKAQQSEVSERAFSEPEHNLIYFNARVAPVGVNQYQNVFANGDQGHAALIDFMNAPDSLRLVSRISEVRGIIRFNEINGTQQFVVTKGVWLGADREYVSLKPGDNAPLIAAVKLTNGQKFTLAGRYIDTRRPFISSQYRPEHQNLTGTSYHINVKLIRGERESELIGEYDFKLTLEPDLKLERVDSHTLTATDYAKEARRHEYIIERLKELIRQHDQLPGGLIRIDDPMFNLVSGWHTAASRFLEQYSDEAHATRFEREGVKVLDELLNEYMQ